MTMRISKYDRADFGNTTVRFPQYDRAVSAIRLCGFRNTTVRVPQYDRAVSQYDRTVSQYDCAVVLELLNVLI